MALEARCGITKNTPRKTGTALDTASPTHEISSEACDALSRVEAGDAHSISTPRAVIIVLEISRLAAEAERGGAALAAAWNYAAFGAAVSKEVILVHAGRTDCGIITKLAALYLGTA